MEEGGGEKGEWRKKKRSRKRITRTRMVSKFSILLLNSPKCDVDWNFARTAPYPARELTMFP